MMIMMNPINLQFSNLKKITNPYPTRSLKLLLTRKNSYQNSFKSSQELAPSLVHEFNPNIPIQEAITPPSSWYTSPDFLSLEFDHVFFKGWQAVGNHIISFLLFLVVVDEFVLMCMLLFDFEVKLGDFESQLHDITVFMSSM